MKVVIVLSVLAVVACVEYYDAKYDDFNAEELVENDRLLKAYGKCFVNTGPCTPEGESFKQVIPDAIRTKCAKCSPKQRVLVRTVIKGFQQKSPEQWEEIVKHFDSKGEFKKDFDEFINATN